MYANPMFQFMYWLKVTQLCPTLFHPIDSTVHGILQARILEWIAFSFSDDPHHPRIKPGSPVLQVDSLPAEPQGKPKNTGVGNLTLLQRIFPILELNQGLLSCRQIFYQLSYQTVQQTYKWLLLQATEFFLAAVYDKHRNWLWTWGPTETKL